MSDVTLIINDEKVKAKEGLTILEAARGIGIDIPALCYDENMAPYGACRLCTVEISRDNRTRLVASCIYTVENKLVVKTESERVIKIRKMILELLLPRCPTGPIEALAKKYGLEKSRFSADNADCILCGLCVRYCEEINKANAIGFIGRGVWRNVAFLPEVATTVCLTCRKCFSLCPGGKLVKGSLDGTWFPPLGWQKKL